MVKALLLVLGLAALQSQVSGRPRTAHTSSHRVRRNIDLSQYAFPASSTYQSFLGDAQVQLASSGSGSNYTETATGFVRETMPGREFRMLANHYVGKNGIAHIHFKQTINGLDVDNGDFNVNIAKDGNVFSYGSNFYSGETLAESSLTRTSVIDPTRALRNVIRLLEVPLDTSSAHAEAIAGSTERYAIRGTSGAESDPKVSLVYFKNEQDILSLSWKVETSIFLNWFVTYIDAVTGDDIYAVIDDLSELTMEVYPWGLNDPTEGARVVIEGEDQGLSSASPFGWFGNGSINFTTTEGNNAVCIHDISSMFTSPEEDYEDVWEGGYRPNSPDLSFEYPFSLSTGNPAEYSDASITQLFYTVNMYHDLLYILGFTEEAGNFQMNNNGNGGVGNDFVILSSQDTLFTNNAAWLHERDGRMPVMFMMIWTSTSPHRDSAFDAGVVIHEYTHGVSQRLTGGNSNQDCMSNLEAQAMGEGWGDFMATAIRIKEQDTRQTNYPIASWLNGRSVGLRQALYSTDLRTNSYTYRSFGSGLRVVHYAGMIWANILYEMLWNLIDKHGKNTNAFPEFDENGVPTDGRFLAIQLVLDGMAMQPCNPSIPAARDAILDADRALTGGANLCEIWTAFAKRGMGPSTRPLSWVDDYTIPDG
ncbi:hypothetical protein S40293_10277, partial [Stachybotrys chartarum IBT 40293]